MTGTATSTATVATPEVGQVVTVRDRHWAVTDVRASALPADPALPAAGPQHLVELSSVEDDGYGDELGVVWEVEADARVLDAATLPTPRPGAFDPPDRLDAFTDAVRWGAIASADDSALQAPFRSGIQIDDYQLDPVVRALRMPRVNLLIADDVGLGKTIEAGLVVQEMLLRHRARTVLVVCPASLCIKWRDEMASKFGLEFRIVDAAAVRALRRSHGVTANIWRHFPRLIVSIQWLRMPRAQALLDAVLPADPTTYPRAFDLLVVDEVHTCAPAGTGRYATDSLSTRTIRRISPHFEHRLFLSATPHNGYTNSFTSLLELLDPQRFARDVMPSDTELARAMVRRLKSELPPRDDGTPRFATRRIAPLEVDYTGTDREAHALLAEYTRARGAAAGSKSQRAASEFVTMLLKKRLFSSPAAFASTLATHVDTLARKAPHDDRLGPLQAAFGRLDDDVADDDELGAATADAIAAAARAGGPVTDAEAAALAGLQRWAAAHAGKVDAKTAALVAFLVETCRPGGRWNDERVIVFTEYRDTQNWLTEVLTSEGLGGDRLALVYGGMDPAEREQIRAEFQADPRRTPVRILLATDAASEGIDLQLHCHRVVHHEIPWSPTRLEQRNGRVDRHGQPAPEVLVHHFVPAGWRDGGPRRGGDASLDGDLDFLGRIVAKVDQVRTDLGSAGPLLARDVEDFMLGRSGTAAAVEATSSPTGAAGRAVLKVERDLRADLARLRETLDTSVSELGINPAAAARVVQTALALAHQPLLHTDGADPAGTYRVPALTGAWARATIGLADPIDGTPRPITFDHAVADDHGEAVVLAHLGHPLVAQAQRLLRAEVWASDADTRLARVTARLAAPGTIDAATVVCHARLVITGADGRRLHEQVITAGGRWRNGRFARTNVGDTAAALAAATDRPAPDAAADALARDWGRIEGPLNDSITRRGEDLAHSMQATLDDKARAEAAAITAVLEQLRDSIAAQLARAEMPEQLSFDESEQYERDLDALRRRLDEIPEEIEREVAHVAARYADPSRRLFPVAVTFVVPEGARS